MLSESWGTAKVTGQGAKKEPAKGAEEWPNG